MANLIKPGYGVALPSSDQNSDASELASKSGEITWYGEMFMIIPENFFVAASEDQILGICIKPSFIDFLIMHLIHALIQALFFAQPCLHALQSRRIRSLVTLSWWFAMGFPKSSSRWSVSSWTVSGYICLALAIDYSLTRSNIHFRCTHRYLCFAGSYRRQKWYRSPW